MVGSILEAPIMKWPPENLEELLKRSGEILRAAGATAVYVFGSAATGRMHEASDVDLAVSGLSPKDYLPAKVKVGNLFGRSVDLIDLDLVSPFTSYLKTKAGALRRVV
jgi:predicted nucleotidyltransferase